MKTQLTHEDAKTIGPDEIISTINTGVQIVEATLPFLTLLFDKIKEAIDGISGPNSPAGRLKRIEALEAQNLVQKELNKLYNEKLGLQ